MREIRFRAWDGDTTLGYKMSGYQMRKVKDHPHANKRGYVPEHRLIIENSLGRYLIPRKELVHHINHDRADNRLSNLKLSNPKDHAKGHIGSRNDNGTFVCKSKEFQEKKFRLYDADRNLMRVFTLNELIAKTYRRGSFEYRGEFTGLKDKNGVEIYEGDIVYIKGEGLRKKHKEVVIFKNGCFGTKNVFDRLLSCEVIGNIYENEDLL